ncbi:MAG: hypothetical protein RL088_3225 [Verrucomicrobiota bacterium]|jgi:hypothetical protein
MKNENTTAAIDTTGVSEWWFTRNIIAGLFGIAASLSLNIALTQSASAGNLANQPEPQSASIAAR